MSECFEQKRIRLADIIANGEFEGYFAPRSNESRSEFVERLAEDDSEPGKALRYMEAMRRGATFPPVLVARVGDEYLLSDGWHRCAAAAGLGYATISAAVFHVTSIADADLISEFAFEFSENGAPWVESIKLIGAVFKCRDERMAAAAPNAKARSRREGRTRSSCFHNL